MNERDGPSDIKGQGALSYQGAFCIDVYRNIFECNVFKSQRFMTGHYFSYFLSHYTKLTVAIVPLGPCSNNAIIKSCFFQRKGVNGLRRLSRFTNTALFTLMP